MCDCVDDLFTKIVTFAFEKDEAKKVNRSVQAVTQIKLGGPLGHAAVFLLMETQIWFGQGCVAASILQIQHPFLGPFLRENGCLFVRTLVVQNQAGSYFYLKSLLHCLAASSKLTAA